MARERLKAEVNAGVEQLDAGDSVDGDEVFDEIRRRAESLAKNGTD